MESKSSPGLIGGYAIRGWLRKHRDPKLPDEIFFTPAEIGIIDFYVNKSYDFTLYEDLRLVCGKCVIVGRNSTTEKQEESIRAIVVETSRVEEFEARLKNITPAYSGAGYIVRVQRAGQRFHESFETMPQAVIYRDKILAELGEADKGGTAQEMSRKMIPTGSTNIRIESPQGMSPSVQVVFSGEGGKLEKRQFSMAKYGLADALFHALHYKWEYIRSTQNLTHIDATRGLVGEFNVVFPNLSIYKNIGRKKMNAIKIEKGFSLAALCFVICLTLASCDANAGDPRVPLNERFGASSHEIVVYSYEGQERLVLVRDEFTDRILDYSSQLSLEELHAYANGFLDFAVYTLIEGQPASINLDQER